MQSALPLPVLTPLFICKSANRLLILKKNVIHSYSIVIPLVSSYIFLSTFHYIQHDFLIFFIRRQKWINTHTDTQWARKLSISLGTITWQTCQGCLKASTRAAHWPTPLWHATAECWGRTGLSWPPAAPISRGFSRSITAINQFLFWRVNTNFTLHNSIFL